MSKHIIACTNQKENIIPSWIPFSFKYDMKI